MNVVLEAQHAMTSLRLEPPVDPGQSPGEGPGGGALRSSRNPKAYISQKYTLVVHLH